MVIAIIALLIALLLPALRSARRTARTAVCQSNIRQMMVAHNGYAADSQGFIAAFNGRAEDRALAEPVQGGPPGRFPGPTHVAIQAQNIIASLSGRPIGADGIPDFSHLSGHTYVVEQFSHVMLAEYLDNGMPSPVTACPEDRARLSWRSAPLSMEESPYVPQAGTNRVNLQWWPYSASYQLAADACAGVSPHRDKSAYYQHSNHDSYDIGKAVFGGRKIDEVMFPSQKVALYDSQDRHIAKKELFFAFPEARQPFGFFDGAVSTRKTGDANLGENPGNWRSTIPVVFSYNPDRGFESPVPVGMGTYSTTIKAGYYRWTRGGLKGIDYGGGEVKR